MLKKCTRCGKEFPATKEYFYVRKVKKDGLTSECKICLKLRSNNYYNENKYKQNEQSKKYHKQNKDKIAIKMKEYYENNKEKIIKSNNIYAKNNKDKVTKWKKKYVKNNKGKIAEHAKIYYENNNYNQSEYRKNYHKTKKGKIISRINRQKRRARKKELESTFTENQWLECKEYFENKCCYCGKETKLAQEHFIPLFGNGEYTLNNIIPACKSCNTSKHAKDFFEWYPKQEFYNKQRERKILEYLNYNIKTKTQQLALI